MTNFLALGQLVGLIEHKVFLEDVIRGINSFDLFCIEFGERLGRRIYRAAVATSIYGDENDSTSELSAGVRAINQAIVAEFET